MLSLISLGLLCLQDAFAIPAPEPQRAHGLKKAKAEHIMKLKRVGVKSPSSRQLLLDLGSDFAPLDTIESGAAYGVEISLSGDNYDVIFDTGSSDLWVFHEGITCLNVNAQRVPTSRCGFGPLFPGTFDDGEIDNQNFFTTYGSGEAILGVLGFEDVTVGGVTVNKQKMALADVAYWQGDGETSGILGFARSSITSAYPGTDASSDTVANNMPYTNFLDNAIDQNKFDPVFSVILERGEDGEGSGQLALGGLPDAEFDKDFATTSIEKIEVTGDPIQKTKFSYYTIIPDGLVIGEDSRSTSFPAIVDTGTTLAYFPNNIAIAINNAYDPPSTYVSSAGVYINDCDATPPDFAITIGGVDFKISPEELILQSTADAISGGCVTGIQRSGFSSAILGATFLKNVVAVFDIGNQQMKFAPHVNY